MCFLVLCSAAFAAQNFQRTIPLIELRDGRVLREVSIVSFTSTVVMAKWADGQGTIPYQLFPADWREAALPVVAERKIAAPAAAPDPAAVEALVSRQAAEIAELRRRDETLEKRFRQY